MRLFSDFQYGFRSSQSTAYLLKVVSDKIAEDFYMSAASQDVALDISTTFGRFGMLVFSTNLTHGISCHVFGLILPFLRNRWL